LAEGDKVVPSEGNSQLDPTKKNSGALNERLGVTGGSLTGDKTRSGSLSSRRFIRNQSGLLTNVDDLEMDVARKEVLNRYSKDKGMHKRGVVSEDILRNRDQKRYESGLQSFEKRGSSQGDEQASDASTSTPIIQPPKPITSAPLNIQGIKEVFSTPPNLVDMMSMPIAYVPMVGGGKRYCGPAIISTFNFTGGSMQSNAHESMTTGMGVNLTPRD
jgi:hypothetical protein